MTTKDIADQIIQKESERDLEKLQIVTVNKLIPLELDLGRLTSTDLNVISLSKPSSDQDKDDEDQNGNEQSKTKLSIEEHIALNTRDNVQFMLNALWDLETQKIDGLVIAKLPKPKTALPRSKPPPQARQPTKWETFAKAKGIVKKTKKDKKVWDPVLNDWRPTYGYKRAAAERDANWCMPIPDTNKDPNADMFAKVAEEKKEKVAKNEFQRLRNIARQQKAVMGVPPAAAERNLSKEEANLAATFARSSTASVGKFDKDLKNEKPAKNTGKKRQFDSNFRSGQVEKDKNLQIVDQIMSKAPKVDIEKAVDSLLSHRGNSVKINDSAPGKKGQKRSKAGGKPRGRPQKPMGSGKKAGLGEEGHFKGPMKRKGKPASGSNNKRFGKKPGASKK